MRHVLLTAAAAALAACGGGDGGGGGGPAPTPASVTVTAAAAGALPSIGDTRGLTAVVRDAAGTTLPSAAVSWASTPSNVLSLSGTSGASVTAAAAANGTAVVTATSGSASGTASVEVAQRLSSVAATPNPVQVTVGGTRQLVPAARDARENGIGGATGFTYGTSDAGVATVSGTGLVTGMANGTATVTVSLVRDGVTAATPVPVTVAALPTTATIVALASNAFTPSSVEIAAGGSVTWTFQALHNVTFSTPSAPEDITERATGSVSRTFPAVGTFNFTCTLHAGMAGQVLVR